MIFYSRSNPRPHEPIPHGSAIRSEKVLHVDALGNKRLEVVREFNQYEVIQSFADETKIEKILERYERGDLSALNQRQPMYFDATAMPQTLAEMYEVLRKAEDVYNNLDSDTRRSIGSYSEFLAEFSTSDGISRALSALGLVEPSSVDVNDSIIGGDVNA